MSSRPIRDLRATLYDGLADELALVERWDDAARARENRPSRAGNRSATDCGKVPLRLSLLR